MKGDASSRRRGRLPETHLVLAVKYRKQNRMPPDHIQAAAPVELSGGGVAFSLTKLDDEAQRLWTRGFSLVQLKRLQPNQYEATGPVPEYAASGAYRLTRAWSGVSDLSKNYDYPDTLHQDITIRVINEKRDPLPALTEIKLIK